MENLILQLERMFDTKIKIPYKISFAEYSSSKKFYLTLWLQENFK